MRGFNYEVRILDGDKVSCSVISPYDWQDYYYSIGDMVYRQGEYIETVNLEKQPITKRLDELNSKLKAMIDRN